MGELVRGGWAVARGTARIAAGAASHVAWWLNYRVGGLPREAPEDKRRRPHERRRYPR